ncbi:MAG: folate-binding protein [Methyloceanibacter sp.]|nr:folate-binding protein [Methyloceanibacter sp.]
MSHRAPEVPQVTALTDRGVLRVSGTDAKSFLQGLVTNNMDKMEDGNAIFAGLLTPQGKIIIDFFVVADGDAFLIDAPKDDLEALAKRLSFYKLRSSVSIDAEPAVTVAAAWGGTAPLPAGAVAFADPRLADLGDRILLPEGTNVDEAAYALASEGDYHSRRIALGIPDGGRDYAYSNAFPHDALYDQLNGVDFNKGCYVGQEVVSRMHHRKSARKRVVPIEGDAPLPEGAEVMAGTQPVGTIGSVDETRGLALLRLDRVASAEAKGALLHADGTAIKVRLPKFATFELPTAEGA